MSSGNYYFIDTNVINDKNSIDVGKKLPEVTHKDIIILQLKNGAMLGSTKKILVHELVKNKADFVYCDETDSFKPDWSPDTLRSRNYISGIIAITGRLFIKSGLLDKPASCVYDLVLRLTENAEKIIHTDTILFAPDRSESNTDCSVDSDIKALGEHLQRIGMKNFSISAADSIFRIFAVAKDEPLVSILIPNCDHVQDLRTCVNSILNKSSYKNIEIIIIENNSKTKEIFDFYEQMQCNPLIKILHYNKKFNYSAVNNFAAKHANGKYLILLNNDTEVRSTDWIEELLSCMQFPNAGCVGALLSYCDKTVQHAGIVLKMQNGTAGHLFQYEPETKKSYEHRLDSVQNVSAVTGACLMVKTSVYNEMHGLDERFAVSYNDVDFCLRLRKKGYYCLFTPYAKLFHYESKSRGKKRTVLQKVRFLSEILRLHLYHFKSFLYGDPYYSKHLPLNKTDCAVNLDKKVRIFVAMHKDFITPAAEIFETVQCGCDLTDVRIPCRHFDNCGETISYKNKNYCELTALYAMWKNGKTDGCDFVGLMHYRRYLYPLNDFKEHSNRIFLALLQRLRLSKFLKVRSGQLYSGKKNTRRENMKFAWSEIENFMHSELHNYDLLVPYPDILPCSVYKNYCDCHRESDLQAMTESIKNVFPDFLPYFRKALKSHKLYIGNVFVMRKDIFDTYMRFLFAVLEDVEKKIVLPTDTYQARVFGFLGERLFSAFVVYCKSLGLKIHHTWILNIKIDTEE